MPKNDGHLAQLLTGDPETDDLLRQVTLEDAFLLLDIPKIL